MNLYLISQTVNDDYDTYDSAVVAAESEDEARKMHPGQSQGDFYESWWTRDTEYGSWASRLEDVKVELIGVSHENVSRVICASFNAG